MRKTHFLLIGMLLISCIAVNYATPIIAEEPRGTRSPGADVNVTSLTGNQTGMPTETLTYTFGVNNTGDQNDSFEIFAISEKGWELDVSDDVVGPLEVNESIEVTVDITIPMGIPVNTVDNLEFRARSESDVGVDNQVIVSTNVTEAFVLSMDIEGGYFGAKSIDENRLANYTLTIRNKGNDDVTVTLRHSLPSTGWSIEFPDYSNDQVTIYEANLTHENFENVNVTITAPASAQPDDFMITILWIERTSPPPWYSWEHQENITLTTTVEPVLGVVFTPENYKGYVGFGDTLYNFTLKNSGNKDVIVDLSISTDQKLVANLDISQVSVDVGDPPIDNTLRVSAARNTELGNYTINISATDNNTGYIIGYIELYYIIVPTLNITDISVSDPEPLQYKVTTLTTTIENIGPVDAQNITVKFYDGDNEIGKKDIVRLNATLTSKASIEWRPSDFGNRSIRVAIDVKGDGNYNTSHGASISEKFTSVDVKINWQPYYLAIFILIIIVLGVAFLSGALQLRYYKGIPHVNDYGEEAEEAGYGEYPEEPFPEDEEEERALAPFGTAGEENLKEPLDYEMREEKAAPTPPPRTRERPIKREAPPPMVPSKDPETLRKEDELRDEIARAEDELYKTKNLGVDTANIDQLLRTAKKSLRDGEYNKTKQYLGYANERLRNLTAKRDEAQNAIKEAKELLSGMRGTTDLTIVENFLMKADSLFEDGDYREAKNYANKAKERAIRLQRREMRL